LSTKKLYILNIRFETQTKRLYFKGFDTDAANQRFNDLQKQIPEIGEKSAEWSAFVRNVIDHFQGNGFTRIQG